MLSPHTGIHSTVHVMHGTTVGIEEYSTVHLPELLRKFVFFHHPIPPLAVLSPYSHPCVYIHTTYTE